MDNMPPDSARTSPGASWISGVAPMRFDHIVEGHQHRPNVRARKAVDHPRGSRRWDGSTGSTAGRGGRAGDRGELVVNAVDEPYGELASSFAGIARALFSAPTVLSTLQQIVDFAFATVEGCDVACISLRAKENVFTPAYSAPLALEVDQLQYAAREGPCLDAISKEPTVYAEDLADDQRWPVFGPQAAALGMRSLLSCRLSANGTRGALNLYAALPRAYGVIDRTKARIFAAHAGIALGVAEAREDTALSLDIGLQRIEDLIAALGTRETIGQAEGILIERERITPDQAFDALRRASQHLNIKLREVAMYVVETGEVPSD
jgi:ANTAR domain/GAF domain